MKSIITLTLFLLSFNLFAQKPCEFTTNISDSLGTYKTTKEYMVYEKNFAGNNSYIFYSIVLTNDIPTLKVQLVQKSKDFIKVTCFDKNSKLILQLNNGKIITFLHANLESCGTRIKGEQGYDNRILTGIFIINKDAIAELKKSPVSLMEIKYATDTEDYIFKKELVSELNNQIYTPETYFMDNINCIL